jgi:hypothetical protein
LATEECLAAQTLGDLLGHVKISLVHEFLDKLVRRCGIEDVVLDWYVFVVQLM